MKAYTDINQSKKLAEILPLETADMYYFTIIRDYPYSQEKIKTITKIMDGSFSSDYDTPCWSLAALMNVLDRGASFKTSQGWACQAYTGSKTIISNYHNNPVDACYEIIIRLHELNLL